MKIITAVLLLILSAAAPLYAHVDAGNMPDSVAEMEYMILLEFKPEDTLVRTKLGLVLYRQDKLAEAESEFNKVLAKLPDDFDCLEALGLIRMKQKRYAQAIILFKSALKQRQDDAASLYYLGEAYELNGQYRDAVDTFNKVLNLINTDDPDLHLPSDDINAAAIKQRIAHIKETQDKPAPRSEVGKE